MALYEAFSYSVRLRYKARLCSKTTLFYLLSKILTFALPLIIILSGGIWQSVDHYREQPDVSFKHKMLLLLETKDLDGLIFWSTYKNLNELIPREMQSVVPIIEHREEDYNRDGKYDELLMNIKIPHRKKMVLSVKLLLMFDYKLHLNARLQMECATYIYHSSPLPGSSLYVIGDLNLFQREPLSRRGTDSRYNVSVIEESQKDASFLKLENIFIRYMQRNVTTSLLNQYPVWKSGYAETFEIALHIKYPEQTILYKIELFQIIKGFIVQYMAFFAIFSYVFYKIQKYVFQKQLVPSIVISPLKQS